VKDTSDLKIRRRYIERNQLKSEEKGERNMEKLRKLQLRDDKLDDFFAVRERRIKK